MFVGCQMPTDDVKDILTTSYRVNVTENTYKANVSVDKVTPKAGDTVVITITVPADFSADDLKLSVMKGTETITFTDEEITENNKVKKSFTMPESDVEVTVNFEKKATPTVDAEYTITIVAPHGTVELDKTKAKAGETVKLTKLEADDGYRLETMSIKKENGEDVTELDRKNQSFTMPASNVTVTVNFKETTSNGGSSNGGNTPMTYTLVGEPDSAAKYVLANLPKTDNPSEYAEGDTVTFSIKTKTGETPTGLYLVKVTITERYSADKILDVPVTVTKDHTVSFTMPAKDVMVRADFEDVVCRREEDDDYNFPNLFKVTTSNVDTVFQVALRFDKKDYDNLEPFGGKFIYEFRDLESAHFVGSNQWNFYIQLGKVSNVYDKDNSENCNYYENPVVIYNGEMIEPRTDKEFGSRFVDLDDKLKNQK